MIKHAGLAIFIYGNKDDEKGGWKNSSGMIEEFEVAVKLGAVPLPVGATGYAAEELWNKVMANPSIFYPDNPELLKTIKTLGDKSLTDKELIRQIMKAIELLQTIF